MPTWNQTLRTLHRLAHRTEEEFDALLLRFKRRTGRLGPVQILPYRGFGTARHLQLKGRVLEDKGIGQASDHDTVWENMLATYKRFESNEIPGVRLRATFRQESGQAVVQEAVTDTEGYFDVHIEPAQPLSTRRVWQPVELELLDAVTEDQDTVRAIGHVLVPRPASEFGVISDLDDTVLKTGATNFFKMARITFLNNAKTRLPFAGVGAFYRALQRGPDGAGHNPIFYVSSSPWNLYDLFLDFCDAHGIPKGPFLLRDLGLDENKFIKSSHHGHKLAQIERILATYPDLPFVLIGDSGQKDPEIYRTAVEHFPNRIRAIYIRDVTGAEREAEVQAIARNIRDAGAAIAFVADTYAAAEHAAEHGLLDPAALSEVQAEKSYDDQRPGDLEQLLGLDD